MKTRGLNYRPRVIFNFREGKAMTPAQNHSRTLSLHESNAFML